MSLPECPICLKHRGQGPLVGPVIYQDNLLYVAHRATGSPGYAFIETQRHVSYLDELTDAEAEAVGRTASRLAFGLRAELDVEFVHSMVAGMAVAHFHQHVFVRHRGTPERYAWWEQWPDAPQGDVSTLAARLQSYLTGP
jgi:ATP adenylyltransferase